MTNSVAGRQRRHSIPGWTLTSVASTRRGAAARLRAPARGPDAVRLRAPQPDRHTRVPPADIPQQLGAVLDH